MSCYTDISRAEFIERWNSHVEDFDRLLWTIKSDNDKLVLGYLQDVLKKLVKKGSLEVKLEANEREKKNDTEK